MGHEQTDPSIIDLLVKESEEHGFTPYRVRKPSVGYIYNRLVVLLIARVFIKCTKKVS
jgi:hypothetical protein